jgi:hypothetical protein
MRILACLGFALVATTANAQSVTTTVNPETHAATTRDPEHPASGKVQAAHTTNPTIPPTTAHGGEDHQPMGDDRDRASQQ